MSNNQSAGRPYDSFASAFFSALVAAITQASGVPWFLAALPDAGTATDESEPARLKLTIGGNLEGEVVVEFSHVDAAMLASICLQQPIGEWGEEQSQALLKLIESGIGEFCTALMPGYGPCTVKVAPASQPASDPGNMVEFTAADQDANRVSMRVYLDTALVEALSVVAEAG